MGTVEIYGLGAAFERDVAISDRVAVFRWKLDINQANNQIYYRFNKIQALGGYDGWYNFDADIKAAHIDYPCGTDGRRERNTPIPIGKTILVASVSNARGSNASWSVGVSGGGSSSGPSGSLSLSWSNGYPSQRIEWEFEIHVCPGANGCPNVRVTKNSTSVTDSEYFWADWATTMDAVTNPNLVNHKPQAKISRCNGTVYTGDTILPLSSSGGTIHTAS